MITKRFGCALLVTLAVTAALLAWTSAKMTASPQGGDSLTSVIFRGVQTAVQFDVSPPLRSFKSNAPSVQGPVREIREGRGEPQGQLGPQSIDAVVQAIVGPGAMPAPSVSFDGPSNTFSVAPPDPVGDVGPNHYVASSNLSYQIYSKTGVSLAGPFANNTLWSGFGGACQTENAGDPIVVYDQIADRWILTQFTANGPTYYNCVAISTTGDPTGTYYRYAISTGSNFPDYPKYGVWSDAYYIATREYAGGSTFAGVGVYALNRSQMLAGNPSLQVISFLATPGVGTYNIGDGLLPADLDGSMLPPAGSPEYFVGSMDDGALYGAPSDALTLWKFHADWAVPANSTFSRTNTLAVAAVDTMFPCSGRSCIPQPGTAQKVDHLGYRQRPLHRLAYRNFGTHESMVTTQSVEAAPSVSGMRWYELRGMSTSPVVYQQGTFAPGITDTVQRWMGSIAMDGSGNMALGYSASNATSVYPSVAYTGRLNSDPLGTMPQGEGLIIAGTGSQTTTSGRWGDYSSMNVDPIDDCTFWYVNQYLPTTSPAGWRLRIGAFKFPSCGAVTPLAPTGLYASSIVGNTVTLRWNPPASGATPTEYILEGGSTPGDVAASLPTGSASPIFTLEAPTGAWYVRMHTQSASGRSVASNEIRIFVNLPQAPSAPVGLVGVRNGSTLDLAWRNTFTGGAPTAVEVNVTGTLSTSVVLGPVETFSFAPVPGGTYNFTVRAGNAGGVSASSNSVTLSFPGTCAAVPFAPVNFIAYRIGSTIYVVWDPAPSGPAPTGYVLVVTGAFSGSFPTTARSMSGAVGSGTYYLSAVATNACGSSIPTVAQILIVP